MDDSQKNQTGITIVGLGPGDADLITRHAWRVLENSQEVYLRTRQHPAVDQLPVHLAKYSIDDLYERAETFEEVYSAIVDKVLELGRRPQGVIYAVPGHPFVAEATAPDITRRARMEGLSVHVIEGIAVKTKTRIGTMTTPPPIPSKPAMMPTNTPRGG